MNASTQDFGWMCIGGSLEPRSRVMSGNVAPTSATGRRYLALSNQKSYSGWLGPYIMGSVTCFSSHCGQYCCVSNSLGESYADIRSLGAKQGQIAQREDGEKVAK